MALRGEEYRRFVQAIPSPAVGAEIDIVPFGMGTWRVQSFIFTLTTSAVAGVRSPILSATDGTTEWWRSPSVATLGPSSAGVFVAHPGIVAQGGTGAEVAKQASNAFAAAGTGVAALSNGDSVTGITINMQAVAAATTVDVTVTNVQGGTMTFRIEATVPGSTITILFPEPIPALNGGVAPTVTFPGAAGTPAGSVVIYGRAASLDATSSMSFPDEGLVLPQGFHLRTITAGIQAGDQYSAVAILVEELPSGPTTSGYASGGWAVQPLDS